MTAALAGMLRNQFPALMGAHLLIWLGIAGFAYWTGGTLLMAVCIAAAGMLATLLVFGLLALGVENSRLLLRIAEAADRPRHDVGGAVQGSQPELAPTAGAAIVTSVAGVPTRRGAANMGRMEPVVTLRGSNALPGL